MVKRLIAILLACALAVQPVYADNGKMGNNICKYFHKGDLIYVNGHIQTGSYTNKDGNKVYTTDVVVDDWEFCGNKSSSGNGSGGQSTIDDYVNAGLDEFS